MAGRSVFSGNVVIGLVKFPIKVYKATSTEEVKFKTVSADGNDVIQKSFDPNGNEIKPVKTTRKSFDSVTNEEIKDKNTLKKAYELSKDEFVVLDDNDFKVLESNGAGIAVNQFIPEYSMDLMYVQESYFLKPDKGGDRAYNLCVAGLARQNKMAIGTWVNKGRDHMVLIRAKGDGLVMHTLFYNNEVRRPNQASKIKNTPVEEELFNQLIKYMSITFFSMDGYYDHYKERVTTLASKKQANPKFKSEIVDEQDRSLDLMTALAETINNKKSTN